MGQLVSQQKRPAGPPAEDLPVCPPPGGLGANGLKSQCLAGRWEFALIVWHGYLSQCLKGPWPGTWQVFCEQFGSVERPRPGAKPHQGSHV